MIVTVAVGIAVLALGSQIAIPAYVSSEVEDRLTENGGTAHVEVHATPAVKLIGGGGDRIEVRGKNLEFELPPPGGDVFDRLDGFDEVDAELTQVRTGPFRLERFTLERGSGEGTYRMAMRASSTPRELTRYATARIGGRWSGLLGRLATGLMPWDDRQVPVTIDAEVRSDDGRATVVSASGDIAGLPVDAVAATLAAAVADRL